MENSLTDGVREVEISESVDVTVYFPAIGMPSSSSTDSLVPGSSSPFRYQPCCVDNSYTRISGIIQEQKIHKYAKS